MTIEVQTYVVCDGTFDEVGCSAKHRVSTTVTNARAMMKVLGWTRRHHEDTQIDLCPDCSATFVPNNVMGNRGGRPPANRG